MRHLILSAILLAALAAAAPAAAQEVDPDAPQEFDIGEKVELFISGSMWQPCVVIETDPIMRVRCQAYSNISGYKRAGGVYIVYSRRPNEIRRVPQQQGQAGGGLPEGAFQAPPGQ